MQKIRLGVFFDQKLVTGGGYQQAINAARIAQRISDEISEVIFFCQYFETIKTLENHGINSVYLPLSKIDRIILKLRSYFTNKILYKIIKKTFGVNRFEKVFKKKDIDVVYFISPNQLAKSIEDLNYIVTIWDLCHRDQVEFPEIRLNREFESREDFIKTVLPKALAIFVDSEKGKSNLIRRYGLDEYRIFIMEFMPNSGVIHNDGSNKDIIFSSVLQKYNIKNDYIFYPAQFWAHKNHIYILNGIKTLRDKFKKDVHAVFVGGDKGSLEHIRQATVYFGLESNVKFLGFIDNSEMASLYLNSLALVMPTYFGPTNLPPLEAFNLGVPVFYPNLDGLRDQVGDAAMLIDLSDPDSFAFQLNNFIDKPMAKQLYIEKGKKIMSNKALENLEKYQINIFNSILMEFKNKLVNWK